LQWCSSARPRRATYVVAWDGPPEITKPSCLGFRMQVHPTRDPQVVAKLSRVMSECIPGLVARSTVFIVASVNQHVRALGTGTLLAVAEHRFLVTAAHVAHGGATSDATLAVSGAADGRFVALPGSWILTGERDKRDSDEHDIAIYEFGPDQASRFDDDAFVRVADADFPADLSHGYFVVSGFPAIWSSSLDPTDQPMLTKMLQYGTFAYQGSVVGLDGYNQHRHFLMACSPDLLLNGKGEEIAFRTRGGHAAQMPRDLGGISGCSVWMLGDLREPLEGWSKKQARLVGIETSVYIKSQAIRATRWNGVTTLLHAAFPSIRPVLEMYASKHY
jgi:hypothetical protein